MIRRVRLLLSVLALASACEGGGERGGGAGDGSATGGGPAHFRVVNRGSARVYLQVFDGFGFWGLSRSGTVLRVGENCGICNCSDDPCLVCGPVARIGQVAPIDPGGSYSWDWDGQIWKQAGQVNGQVCERGELLSSGPLELSVDHGAKISQGPGGTFLDGPPLTTTVDFDHAANAKVEVIIP